MPLDLPQPAPLPQGVGLCGDDVRMQKALKVGRVAHGTADEGDGGGVSQFGDPRAALLDGRSVAVDLAAVAATKAVFQDRENRQGEMRKREGKRAGNSPSGSSREQNARPTPTNLPLEDLRMDDRGIKDPRYYCLPPFRGNRESRVSARRGGGWPLHLVAQGRQVGIFDNWIEANASLTGYPDASNQGCNTEEECIEVWQRLCVLGVHPHPVDPSFFQPPSEGASAFVNLSPRKSHASGSANVKPEHSPVKRDTGKAKVEGIPAHAPATPELLADLKKYCKPIRPATTSPRKAAHPSGSKGGPFVNYAIRGDSIVSSSAERSEQQYLEAQRRGEEPDLLITRSFAQASLFALDGEDSDAEN
ncbi:hypothetical protein B0H14DRAFT_2655926 [Mycena olivaceomarginata]|nr:hypothetical protein B0H14DRAFT_2655926 [Mycena olivaceomarginata]